LAPVFSEPDTEKVVTTQTYDRESAIPLEPHPIHLQKGIDLSLSVPKGYGINVAFEGLRRLRFMTKSPDGRLFATDMYNTSDNKRGRVYIFEDWDSAAKQFGKAVTFMDGLHNPNQVAFYTDEGRYYIYVSETGVLTRWPYHPGDTTVSGKPDTVATFPDYGLSYKYGGWHLTRTVIAGGNGKIYVAVGSSCNACEEKEEVRATILEMDPDGANQRFFARGLRNAVGLRWVGDKLFATDMGADHLGDHKPADTFYELRDGADYGWPYCYQSWKKVYVDGKYNPGGRKLSCKDVPVAYAAFDAHSSPLGLERFDARNDPALGDVLLVALHGSSKKSLKRGYRLVRVTGPGAPPEDFIDGFLQAGKVRGRPADVLRFGPDAFLFTDDYAGVVYYVYKKDSSTQ